MYYIGVDIVEIARIHKAIGRWNMRFLNRIYTSSELKICRSRIPALAVRFAAKEAVMKALSTGTKGVAWREIEILSSDNGKPVVHLHGKAQNKAEELGIKKFALSLSHCKEYAVASVIGS